MSARGFLARHPALQNALLAALAVLVCGGVLEIVTRLLQRGGTVFPLVYYNTEDPSVTLWCYDEHAWTRPDYDLRKERPYDSITYRSTEGALPGLENLPYSRVPLAIEVRRNAEEFRERPLAGFRDSRDLTLVIGDSFCFGQGVRVRDRFTDLLEAAWRQERPELDVRVANLCRTSADVEQIHEFFDLGLARLPNVSRVLYVYNLNDPVRDADLEHRQRYINDLMHLREYNVVTYMPWILRPLGRSRFVRWALTRIHNRQVTEETLAWYRDLHGDNSGWEATRSHIREMRRQSEARGIPFELAIFPVLYRLSRYPLRGVHRRIMEFCADEGITCLDLLPAFAGARTEEMWVHPTDFHPNHLAHALVADYLRTALAGTPGAAIDPAPR